VPRIPQRSREKPDFLGIVSGGVVLILLAITYIQYPISLSVLTNYLENMATQGVFLKPPLQLIDFAVFFLNAAGLWGIALTVLRIIFEHNIRKAFSDLVGGFFSFFIAYLVTNYARGSFTGHATLAYFIMSLGLLIIANAAVYFIPSKRDRYTWL
jgi:hypothetical protein